MRPEIITSYQWYLAANGPIVIAINHPDPILEDQPPLTFDIEPQIENKIFEIIKEGFIQLSKDGGQRDSQSNAPSEYN